MCRIRTTATTTRRQDDTTHSTDDSNGLMALTINHILCRPFIQISKNKNTLFHWPRLSTPPIDGSGKLASADAPHLRNVTRVTHARMFILMQTMHGKHESRKNERSKTNIRRDKQFYNRNASVDAEHVFCCALCLHSTLLNVNMHLSSGPNSSVCMFSMRQQRQPNADHRSGPFALFIFTISKNHEFNRFSLFYLQNVIEKGPHPIEWRFACGRR